MKRSIALSLTLMMLSVVATAAPAEQKAPAAPPVSTAPEGKRIGVIGLDTSHAPAFAKSFNAADAGPEFNGFRVVAAYPQGSKDIESSTSRVPGYVEQFKAMNIEIVDSIPALLEKVDFVLLESNDGRVHLEQVLPVLEARKPVFIDKPIAASLADTIAIFNAAEKFNTPVWTASSLRFIDQGAELRNGSHGKINGAMTFSPATLEPTHPDLYWYGIHGVEILYTLMGTGCQEVTRVHTPDTDIVVGTWEGGRVGSFRGLRAEKKGYGGFAFTEKGIVPLPDTFSYDRLALSISKFFNTGEMPTSKDEIIEIYTFMAAADESKAQGGVPVKLADVLEKARAEAAKTN